ncbi:MAG: aminotransferase class I/II-fold pyridoxal phosphate-dependent enzyme [Gammaproteobacteria bacterium]
MKYRSDHFETNTIHAGKIRDQQFGALTSPIYQTSTFTFDTVGQGSRRFEGEESGYIYGRLGNPTLTQLEQKMAVLEQTDDAAVFGSGMGAISSTLLANLKAGDHLLTTKALYGCSFALFSHLFPQLGIEVSFVDFDKQQTITEAIQANTKVIYFETPINPNLDVIDIAMVVRVAKRHKLITVVDNTFMSPALQTPSELGVDLIIHSATKYLNGHGDVVAGICCGSQEQIEKIKLTTLKDMGATLSPNDAWLILRGLKTLHLRVERHNQNAQHVAEYLQQHRHVRQVYYPGLPSHSGFKYIGTQMKGAGGVIAFELTGCKQQAVEFMNALKLCIIAVSLGDAETLIQHPATMTHSTYTDEEREAEGINDTLIRIAVGLEHVDDIVNDLEQALDIAFEEKLSDFPIPA